MKFSSSQKIMSNAFPDYKDVAHHG